MHTTDIDFLGQRSLTELLTQLVTMDPSDYNNEITEDWTNRENSETICTSLKTVVEFLNRFHSSCRLRLAEMDNRLKILERKIERLDAHTSYNISLQDKMRVSIAVAEQNEQ